MFVTASGAPDDLFAELTSALGKQHGKTRMSTLYISRLVKIAEAAANANSEDFDRASSVFAEALANKGLIYLYGSGHSVLPVQEAFPRYGSYVGFNPLTDPRVMWQNVLGAGGMRENGVREFDHYRVDPTVDLAPDFFVPDDFKPPVSLAKVAAVSS